MGQEEVIKKGWHREAREEIEKQKTVEGKSCLSRKVCHESTCHPKPQAKPPKRPTRPRRASPRKINKTQVPVLIRHHVDHEPARAFENGIFRLIAGEASRQKQATTAGAPPSPRVKSKPPPRCRSRWPSPTRSS